MLFVGRDVKGVGIWKSTLLDLSGIVMVIIFIGLEQIKNYILIVFFFSKPFLYPFLFIIINQETFALESIIYR